jgi:predicted O-methyltransferase YrrM
MSLQQWTSVDRYFGDCFVAEDVVLQTAQSESAAAGLPPIAVSAPQGKFLHLIARMIGARQILEIGALGGYSAIWLARALPPGGQLVTLELDPRHAAIARANLARAGLSAVAQVRVGPAADALAALSTEKREPFDLIFIDADKEHTADYFTAAMKLARVGSVIIVDNVVRNGAVTDAQSPDSTVQGVRRFNELIAHEPRVSATALQTVGSKGYDGFALLLVTRTS